MPRFFALRRLAHQAALADPRRARHRDATAASRRLRAPGHALWRRTPLDVRRVGTPSLPPSARWRPRPVAARGNGTVGSFDPDQIEARSVRLPALDESRRGPAEHHPARRGDRLHPLGHPDLRTDAV